MICMHHGIRGRQIIPRHEPRQPNCVSFKPWSRKRGWGRLGGAGGRIGEQPCCHEDFLPLQISPMGVMMRQAIPRKAPASASPGADKVKTKYRHTRHQPWQHQCQAQMEYTTSHAISTVVVRECYADHSNGHRLCCPPLGALRPMPLWVWRDARSPVFFPPRGCPGTVCVAGWLR